MKDRLKIVKKAFNQLKKVKGITDEMIDKALGGKTLEQHARNINTVTKFLKSVERMKEQPKLKEQVKKIDEKIHEQGEKRKEKQAEKKAKKEAKKIKIDKAKQLQMEIDKFNKYMDDQWQLTGLRDYVEANLLKRGVEFDDYKVNIIVDGMIKNGGEFMYVTANEYFDVMEKIDFNQTPYELDKAFNRELDKANTLQWLREKESRMTPQPPNGTISKEEAKRKKEEYKKKYGKGGRK